MAGASALNSVALSPETAANLCAAEKSPDANAVKNFFVRVARKSRVLLKAQLSR